jgi:hypothetical protein
MNEASFFFRAIFTSDSLEREREREREREA